MFLIIVLLNMLIALSKAYQPTKIDDENRVRVLLLNKTAIDPTQIPRSLFADIKAPNQNAIRREIFAIESQTDFFIECQINSQLSAKQPPQIVWWFRSKSNDSLRLLSSSRDNFSNKTDLEKMSESKNIEKITLVSRIYIDCPKKKHEGEYYCAAIDTAYYHVSKIKLSVLVPDQSNELSKKSCETTPHKMFGPNPARIVEYTSVLFSYEHENVLLKCRTQIWKESFGLSGKLRLFKNPKYLKHRRSAASQNEVNRIGHIWLDNRNKQIKENNREYELLNNGDLVIKNLTFAQHFGQYACITRKGNRIDSVSTLIYPLRHE